MSGRFLPSQAGVCASALVVLAVLCQPGLARGQRSPGLDPGSRRALQIERGRFLEPLPFDVQFYLFGDATPDLVSVGGRLTYLTKNVRDCTVALPPPNAPAPPRGQPALPPIRRIPESLPFDEGGKRQFELSVDALDPNKEYCFEFTLRYRLDAAEIRVLVAEATDFSLRSVTRVDQLAEDRAYDGFRRQVVAAVESAARRKSLEKGLTIVPEYPADSFFNTNIAAQDISLPFRRQFSRTLQGQGSKELAIQSFGEATGPARDAANAFVNDPSLKLMLQQVTAQAGDQSVRLRLTGLEQALSLPNRTLAQVRAAPFGLTGTEAAPVELAAIWAPEGVADRLRNLDARIREYEQLRDLARSLAGNPSLRASAGLAKAPNALMPAQLNAVAQLADDAAEQFGAARDVLENLQGSLADRQAAITTMAEQVSGEIARAVRFSGNTIADWETRAKQYISLDVGLASSQPIDSTFFYLGTNIYTGPVNKKAPLPWSDQSFRKRFAVMAGIPMNPFEEDQTTNQFANAPQTLEGVIGDRPLLVGAGWRLTDVIRFTGGIVMFRVKDANPLVDATPTRHYTWFLAFSTDWDLKGLFTSLGQAPAQAVQPPPTR